MRKFVFLLLSLFLVLYGHSQNSMRVDVLHPISCFGASDGQLLLHAIGGVAPFTYNWINLKTSQEFYSTDSIRGGLSAANYYISITGADGKSFDSNYTFKNPDSLSVIATSLNGCYGGNNGSATATVYGGNSPYIYKWSNGENTQAISNLSTGTYTVTVTDVYQCITINKQVTIQQPSAALTIQENLTQPTTGCNGSISLSVSGGTTPYSYKWSNGETNYKIANLCGGSYSIVVTDSGGCTVSKSYNFNKNYSSNLNILQAIKCFGDANGKLVLHASGGIAPYKYQWFDAASNASIPKTDSILTGLISGNYYAKVIDANGDSSISNSLLLPDPVILNLKLYSYSGCFGTASASASATVTGGTGLYSYHWSNNLNTATIANLFAGNYNIIATDSNQCSVTGGINIIQPNVLSVQIISKNTSTACNANGTASANVSGGSAPYQYRWSTGNTTSTIDKLAQGNYSVTITDAHGCTASTSDTITSTALPITAQLKVSDAACFGSSSGYATVSVSGGNSPYKYIWSDGSSTISTDSNLLAGSYSVLVSDADNCGLPPISFTVSQPSNALSGIISSVNASPCTGANIGSATGLGSGGTAPYTYTWSNGGNTATINNLTPGNYYLTIKDVNLCAASQNLTIIQPDNLSVKFTGASQILCPGSNTGSAIAIVTGGMPPYTYQWANGATTDTISNLAAGSYNVIVKDANQCSFLGNAIIAPSSFNLNVTKYDIICFGNNNGSAHAISSGGTEPYTYLWSNGNTSADIYGGPGTYSVLVNDFNQCSLTKTVDIIQPSDYNLLLLSSTAATCNGASDGSASILVSGGTAPYTYFWKTGDNKIPSNNNLFGGLNNLLIQDANQCPFYRQFNIIQPKPIVVTFNTTNVNCTGGSNGTASISVTGGSPPYQYKWSNGSTSSAISNLTVGSYSVSVTDAHLCADSSSVAIVKADFKDLNLTFITYPANCYNASTGSVIAVVTGGKPPYQYEWSNGDSSYIITNLASAPYQLKVSDDLKCKVINSAFVDQPKPFNVNLITQSIKCFNSNDGSISATVVGGIQPYQNLEWYQNGSLISAGNQSLNNLKAGTYKIIATDSHFCKAITEDILIQPDVISFSGFLSKTPVCFGDYGSITPVGLTGGTPPYVYNWNNQYGNIYSGPDAVLGPIKPGFYNLLVYDKNGCKSPYNDTFLDGATEQVIFEPKSVNPTCFGMANGAVTMTKISGNDPLKFLWADGDTTANVANLLAGTYSVIISDRFGCSIQPIVTLTQPTVLYASSMTAKTLSPFNCSSSQNIAQIDTISGGILPYKVNFYDSSMGSPIQSNLGLVTGPISFGPVGPGKYTAIIQDFNNCIISEQVQLASTFIPMNLSVSTIDNVCFGGSSGSAIFKVSDGLKPYTYTWNLGTNETDSFANNLISGRYNVFIQDSMKCFVFTDFSIGSPLPIKIDYSLQLPSCPTYCDGAINLKIQGGVGPYTYLWSNGSRVKDPSGLCGGDYSVVVTDSNNCIATSATIHLFSATSLHASLGSDYTLCSGQKHFSDATVVNDGASYTWNGPNGFVADGPKQWLTDSGEYKVTVTLGNGCFTNSTIHISRISNIISSEFIVSSEVFKGEIVGLINISDPKPDSVSWIIPNNSNIVIADINKNTANLVFNETGTYSLGIRTWLGECDSIFTKKIQVLEPQNFNNSRDLRTPYIRLFTVAPSPNTGQFTVKIGLDEVGDIRLRLINFSSNQVFNDRRESGFKDYSLQYMVNVPPGLYVMMLETAKGSRIFKIIIN